MAEEPETIEVAFRKPRYNRLGTIDMEIEHPHHGWIPFTADPEDDSEWGRVLYAAALEREVAGYVPPPPMPEDVDRERDRRIDRGLSFQGVVYQARAQDRENIMGASTAALSAIINGAQPGNFRWHGGVSDFVWIAADNSEHRMDARTVFALGQAALNHKQAHIYAARALKDRDPIPFDYADDVHWPQAAG